jgi:hypothetical protein
MNTFAKAARVPGLLALLIGLLMMIVGIGAWFFTASQLGSQGLGFSTPWGAINQANTITMHATTSAREALQTLADGGTTVAPDVLANPNYANTRDFPDIRASFNLPNALNTSLFLSVLAFGVSLLGFGTGLGLALLGWAAMRLSKAWENHNDGVGVVDSAVDYSTSYQAPTAVTYTETTPVTYTDVTDTRIVRD